MRREVARKFFKSCIKMVKIRVYFATVQYVSSQLQRQSKIVGHRRRLTATSLSFQNRYCRSTVDDDIVHICLLYFYTISQHYCTIYILQSDYNLYAIIRHHSPHSTLASRTHYAVIRRCTCTCYNIHIHSSLPLHVIILNIHSHSSLPLHVIIYAATLRCPYML